jgi:hypothetical protein
MERTLRYTEPPSYPRPVLEIVGRKAIEESKPEIAEKAFREALDQFPESSRARPAWPRRCAAKANPKLRAFDPKKAGERSEECTHRLVPLKAKCAE